MRNASGLEWDERPTWQLVSTVVGTKNKNIGKVRIAFLVDGEPHVFSDQVDELWTLDHGQWRRVPAEWSWKCSEV